MQPRAFLPVVNQQHQGVSADSALMPGCFDFAAYLARRLGIEAPLANEVLGEWLRHYEPVGAGGLELEAVVPAPKTAPTSGVRSSVPMEMGRTGTDG